MAYVLGTGTCRWEGYRFSRHWYKERYQFSQFSDRERYRYSRFWNEIEDRIYFFEKLIRLGIHFQKLFIRNGYVFEALKARPQPNSGQVHCTAVPEHLKLVGGISFARYAYHHLYIASYSMFHKVMYIDVYVY